MVKTTFPVWDIFCNVIDNWGDIGVCWRLAKQLNQQHISVRLWVDDPSALAWMASPANSPNNSPNPNAAKNNAPTLKLIHWESPTTKAEQKSTTATHTTLAQTTEPGEAFIEAFGCHAPDDFLEKAAGKKHPPIWINLEYLSAEQDVEKLHGLPSFQQFGTGKGLTRWFYYPGFSTQTGGLLREPDIQLKQGLFNPTTWLQAQGIPVLEEATRVCLFTYPNQALPALLDEWQNAPAPVHMLVTPGYAAEQVSALFPSLKASSTSSERPHTTQHGSLTITILPYLSQEDFDHLLWSCDLNFVRGEDSWVRAIWANKPFVWQPYVQSDDEHMHKLAAFTCLLKDAPAPWVEFQEKWSLQTTACWASLTPVMPEIKSAHQTLYQELLQMPDLSTSLIQFVKQKHEEKLG